MVFRDVGFFDVVIVVGFSVLGKVDFPLAKSVGFTVGIVSFDFPLDKSVGLTYQTTNLQCVTCILRILSQWIGIISLICISKFSNQVHFM